MTHTQQILKAAQTVAHLPILDTIHDLRQLVNQHPEVFEFCGPQTPAIPAIEKGNAQPEEVSR